MGLAIASLVVIAVGVLLILLGAWISVADWHVGRKSSGHPGTEGSPLGLDKTLTALQKLVAELGKHPLGIRLIVFGIVCLLIGGILGGVAGITA